MEPKSRFSRWRAAWDALTICLFVGLLWLPTLDHFFHLDHAPIPSENRLPAQWPRFQGIGRSRQYIAGLESYFNDHFGFRKRLIRWNNHWKAQLFHESSGAKVLIGRDGWLFYLGNRMIDNWRGVARWRPEDLENWKRLLEMRRDWLKERGCKYLFVVAPDKQSVYPEDLPDWFGKRAEPSKVEQFVEYIRAHSTVQVLDLRKALTDAKSIRADYFKTDTHWNQFGAFVGCRAVIQALARQLPSLKPLPMSACKWEPAHRPPGDLASMLGTMESHPETQAFRPVPQEAVAKLRPVEDPLRFPKRKESENAPVYTLNRRASGKAIVFRDSFAEFWIPFLGQHFRRVIYMWHFDWDRPLIEREKPEVVVDEMVERFLDVEDPAKLAREDLVSSANTCVTVRKLSKH